MTRKDAAAMAEVRARDAGLDEDTCDAVVHRSLEIFHEEFTNREWLEFVDQEIALHAQP